MEIISIINHKGGVGKTTSVQNIGAAFALMGNRTLLIDTDPQANLTESFGIFDTEQNIYHSFAKGDKLPICNVFENLDIVVSSLEFAGIELEISARMAREKILSGLIKPLENKYDIILIDCPPSLGLITVNSLVASNKVLIPMEAEFLAYRGINSLVDIINKVRDNFNPGLEIMGVFFTMFQQQRVLSQEIRNQVKEIFGDVLMENTIRVNVSLAESQSNGQDIFSYDQKSNGAKDYLKLVNELIEKTWQKQSSLAI